MVGDVTSLGKSTNYRLKEFSNPENLHLFGFFNNIYLESKKNMVHQMRMSKIASYEVKNLCIQIRVK